MWAKAGRDEVNGGSETNSRGRPLADCNRREVKLFWAQRSAEKKMEDVAVMGIRHRHSHQ